MLSPDYVVAVDLSEVFVDKSTGQPLAGGIVTFYEDTSRTTGKLVYELTGSPPNYTYTALPNPIILSNTGTFQDTSGNNVAIYYYPYDAAGNLQLYYITVTDALGTEQFTREAWPNITENANFTQANIANQITNPQFVDIAFPLTNPLTITVAGAGTMMVPIAPGWILNITSNGAGSVTVQQNSITGSAAYPFNPPYTLTVTPGANVTGLTMIQQLTNNPGIWSPQTGAEDGYLAGSVLLAPLSTMTMAYAPTIGPTQVILTVNNTTGIYAEYNNTIQLPPSTNTQNSNVGYASIVLTLSPTAPTTFSNVQVVGLETNETNVVYNQTTANRQRDYLFHYYNPLLQFKPTASWLIGWDFPLNPAQFLGTVVSPIASGANTSNYVWDQTILFQSANSGVSVAQTEDGSIILASAAVGGTQFALIQYLEWNSGNKALDTFISSNINATTTQMGGIPCTISMWYTNGTLPDIKTSKSIVATLDANGHPATFNQGTDPWVEVARGGLGNATFTLMNNSSRSNYGLSGWFDTTGGVHTALYFAIVVGFGTLANTKTVVIGSVSAVPGQIPTIPSAQSYAQVLEECSRYYQKSFASPQIPMQSAGNADAAWFPSTVGGGGQGICPQITLTTTMAAATPTYIFYNPLVNNAFVYNYNTFQSFTATALQQAGNRSFAINFTADAGCAVGHVLGFHWTADARLGTF